MQGHGLERQALDPDSAVLYVAKEVKESEGFFSLSPLFLRHIYSGGEKEGLYHADFSIKVHEISFSLILSGQMAIFETLSKSDFFPQNAIALVLVIEV